MKQCTGHHKVKYCNVVLLWIFISFLSSAHPSWSADFHETTQQNASISLGAEFSSGTYTTGSTTRNVYLPLIVSWFPTDRLDISMELPFVYQTGASVSPPSSQNSATTIIPQTVARRGTGTTPGMSGIHTATGSSNHSGVFGLGDIILRTGYIPIFETSNLPQIRTSFFIKTPTASASDGLGTGEFDFGGGFDLSKWFGNIHLAGEALYTWQGESNGFGLKNYVSYTAAAGYQITKDLLPMLVIKGASKPSTFSDDLLEIRGRLLWNITERTSLDSFVSHGISQSSPDYGAGTALIYSF